MDSRRTSTNVTTVAVWVRRTMAEMNRPIAPMPNARANRNSVRAHDVLGSHAAEDEDQARQRYRGDDQQEDIGQRREELADDHPEGAQRRRDQHVERLLLALERDGAGRECRGQDEHEQRLEEEQATENAVADAGRERRPIAQRLLGRHLAGETEAREVARNARIEDGRCRHRLRRLLLEIEVDGERERAQQQQVDGQDDERPPAAHPAAQLLDAHRADGRPEATDPAADRASATP